VRDRFARTNIDSPSLKQQQKAHEIIPFCCADVKTPFCVSPRIIVRIIIIIIISQTCFVSLQKQTTTSSFGTPRTLDKKAKDAVRERNERAAEQHRINLMRAQHK
jgi:hypothetical protein